jgi:hypothetical protein
MLGKIKRERFKLNLTATLLHILVLIIVILTSFFQIVYVIAGYDSDYANDWETRLGTIDIVLEAFVSLIVCYVSWFLTHEPAKKDSVLDTNDSLIFMPGELSHDETESRDSFRAKLNRDSRMLYEDVPETPPTSRSRNTNSVVVNIYRADSVFY